MMLGNILSKSYAREGDVISQFLQLGDRFPNSPEAAEALLRVGYLRDRLKQKPVEWESLATNYPRTKEAAEALKCLGHMALRNHDSKSAARANIAYTISLNH